MGRVAGLAGLAWGLLGRKANCQEGQTPPTPPWANAWGTEVEWTQLAQARYVAFTEKKPLLLIVQKSSCPHCINLRNTVSTSPEFTYLSKFFVMVVAEEHDLPDIPYYAPDGNYVPRVLLYDYKGNLMSQYYNKKASEATKYLYRNHWNLLRMMDEAKFSLLMD